MEYCSIRCLAGSGGTITSANHYRHSGMLPNFRAALVVVDDCDLRNPIVLNLREQGWIVHGIMSAERVFPILAHIPYELIYRVYQKKESESLLMTPLAWMANLVI
jgi:hypothetical protein